MYDCTTYNTISIYKSFAIELLSEIDTGVYNTATKVAASLTGQVFGPATYDNAKEIQRISWSSKIRDFRCNTPKTQMARPQLFLAPFLP